MTNAGTAGKCCQWYVQEEAAVLKLDVETLRSPRPVERLEVSDLQW